MAEQKMGTHYVRELCQTFREIAEQPDGAGVKEKLLDIAGRLEHSCQTDVGKGQVFHAAPLFGQLDGLSYMVQRTLEIVPFV